MDFQIRDNRAVAQGRKKLIHEREEYFRLVDQGYGNTEASRLVGVYERTGREWRNGRDTPDRFRPPARSSGRSPVPVASGRYLSQGERLHIADRLRDRTSLRVIAAELGRSPSTVSRELRRNRTHVRGKQYRYGPHVAQSRSDARRPRPKPGKMTLNRDCGTMSRTDWTGGGARNR